MSPGGLWALARGVPLYQWGPRQFVTGLLVFLIACFVSAGMTLIWRRRHVHQMEREGATRGWTWAAFCQLRDGGAVVEGPGSRAPRNGPVGMMWFDGECLSWRPIPSLRRRGYVERTWKGDEVAVASSVRRRHLTGEVIGEVEIYLGSVRVRVFIYDEVGERPALLAAPI